jgi:hypothetical protein
MPVRPYPAAVLSRHLLRVLRLGVYQKTVRAAVERAVAAAARTT